MAVTSPWDANGGTVHSASSDPELATVTWTQVACARASKATCSILIVTPSNWPDALTAIVLASAEGIPGPACGAGGSPTAPAPRMTTATTPYSTPTARCATAFVTTAKIPIANMAANAGRAGTTATASGPEAAKDRSLSSLMTPTGAMRARRPARTANGAANGSAPQGSPVQ